MTRGKLVTLDVKDEAVCPYCGLTSTFRNYTNEENMYYAMAGAYKAILVCEHFADIQNPSITGRHRAKFCK